MEWSCWFSREQRTSRTGAIRWNAFWMEAYQKSQVSRCYPSCGSVAFDNVLLLLTGIEVLKSLAEEGVEKSYSEHYLQDELESTIQEVEKLNTAANQIIASKHRVRYETFWRGIKKKN